MKNNSRPTRKPTRLKGYDYSQPGRYFITICTQNREEILGIVSVGDGALDVPRKSALDVPRKSALAVPKETIQATVKLTAYGKTVEKYIKSGKSAYKNMTVNNYVIMPNHIHLIIDVLETESNSTLANAAIPKFVSALKRMVNKEIGFSAFQRSYHDHIIRNDSEYERIWNYVNSNPLCWEKDCLNGSLDLNENMMIEMMNNYIAGLGNNL